ncbi:MAG: winged helix-turn-helix domain-containing protein, partial [Paramuribaculum sp.]|nr:winged helix-turn-helix domain-containing protein [Paramuribaculum sp.]
MIPPFQQYLYPFLKLMGDGKVRNISQVSDDLGEYMNFTDEELAETYETSGQNRHRGRCSWARTWFLKAGVLESPKRGLFVISKSGRELVESGETDITQ